MSSHQTPSQYDKYRMGPNTTSQGPNRKMMEVRNLNVQNVDPDYNQYLDQNNDMDIRDITRIVVDNR